MRSASPTLVAVVAAAGLALTSCSSQEGTTASTSQETPISVSPETASSEKTAPSNTSEVSITEEAAASDSPAEETTAEPTSASLPEANRDAEEFMAYDMFGEPMPGRYQVNSSMLWCAIDTTGETTPLMTCKFNSAGGVEVEEDGQIWVADSVSYEKAEGFTYRYLPGFEPTMGGELEAGDTVVIDGIAISQVGGARFAVTDGTNSFSLDPARTAVHNGEETIAGGAPIPGA